MRSAFLKIVLLIGFEIILQAALAQESALRSSDQNDRSSKNLADPSLQVERDWVDGRWNQTDVGQFLASNLEVRGNRIAKGLSIKVGERDEGAVCFDTGLCVLRAAWTGGFLQFSPQRFGFIQAPRINGEIAFAGPTGPGWNGSAFRFSGLHLHGKRVTLEYTSDNVRILESPWLEASGEIKIFSRTFELGPSSRPMKLVVAGGGESATLDHRPNRSRAMVGFGNGVLAFIVMGTSANFTNDNGKLTISFPAHPTFLRAKLLFWSGEKNLLPKFEEFAAAANKIDNLDNLLSPGPARWTPELKLPGQRGIDTDILAVDTLAVPYNNPWKALMFLSGVDFAPDGSAFVCTIHGDVWRVSGIDTDLRELKWKRFATGLFQPLGLKVRDRDVFVLGRDQITRLHDRNGDGEADDYENFSNLIETTPGHNYVTCLEQDDSGNFYFVDPKGAHRISPNGQTMETIATGFRNPNGLGVNSNGQIVTVAPQQGEWTPSSAICEIRKGGYYGYGGPKVMSDRPLGFDPPLCWIPHSIDNSSGSQVWVPSNHWGPLGNQMLHLLWGRCGLMLVLRDVVGGVAQGAVVPLPGRFLSGPHRGTFNPNDGHLYIAASTGWQTSAVKDGALHRVRFTGKPIYLPIAWHARSNGLTLTFSQPLDRALAEDRDSFAIHQWNYRYAAKYGSKDWSVAIPDKEGHDEVPLKSVRLSPDGKTVFLELSLRPVMQMEIKYGLSAADGKSMRGQFWLTLNRIDSEP